MSALEGFHQYSILGRHLLCCVYCLLCLECLYAGSWRDVTWPDKWTAATVVSIPTAQACPPQCPTFTTVFVYIAGREAISSV